MPKKAPVLPSNPKTLEYRKPVGPFSTLEFRSQEPDKENQMEEVHALQKQIDGLQQAVRNCNEQITQAVSLMGQMRVEFDDTKGTMQSFRMAIQDFAGYVKNRQ